MPNYTVTNNIDALLKSTSNADARTNLGLGDAATKNTGTAAGTVAAGDDSRIAGAVQTTRTITAGTGLTGGGDLSANRTLTVSYGTTAGTAAQGNDARLSDARTPTAHAASHAAAGSDPITITAAQISGSLTQNTTGTANNVTGTVAIANGGTGQTTANAALNALLPAQASNNTKLLSTDGTNASWTPAFKFSNTKVVGVDAATIQGCIDLVSSPTALTQVQVLIPPGVYNENLTLKPCVSLASTGLNNGQSSIVRIVGTHTLTGGTSAGDNIIQLNGLRMDYQASTSPTLTISATGTTPLLVHMQDCMIGNSNASTSSVGVLVNQYCSLKCNNVKSLANSTSGSGGTHIEVNAGTFYGDQFSTEYGTLALRLSGTGGALKPYAELKQCSLSCTGSNVVDITSTTALFSAGWTGFTNNATTGNGINIATGSVIGVFNSVFVITAGASNYVVTGAVGGVYYSLNNSYSNATGVPYETKVNANISQVLYSSSIPSALTALTGDVTASGTGSQAATVARIQGRNVLSTAPTNGQVLAWNGTAWAPTAAGGTGTVTSVGVSGGTTGLTTSGGPITSSGTITLAGTLAIANGGTGQTTQQAALNALAGAATSGQYLRGNGTNVTLSAIQAADVPTLNQNTTGTASNVTGTVAIANGGTGQTTATAATNALLPSQTSNSGKFLTTDGSNVSWATAGGGTATPVDRQVFSTSSGTWTKPAGAKYVQVTIIGCGATGGNGSKRVVTPTSAIMQGGTGGSSGTLTRGQFSADLLPSTVTVTIGAAPPKQYSSYLANAWGTTLSGVLSTESRFGPFIKTATTSNYGFCPFFNTAAGGTTSAGFDSNPGGAIGAVPSISGRGSSGGVGGLNTGVGAAVSNSTFMYGLLSTPSLTTQPSTTTNFTSPTATSPMHGTGNVAENQTSGGASGMSVANTLCLGGSGGDGGGWFAPVNLTNVATTNGSPNVTCASTTGLNVGMAIIPSAGFAAPTTKLVYVASITNSTTFVASVNANATTSGQTALATCGYGGGGGGGGSTQASTPILITGVNLTSGSTTVDCTSTRGVFVGLTIFSNANIPAGTTVASLVSDTQFTISAAATGNETAGKLVVAGVGTISGLATTSASTAATVSSTLGLTWGQALWASSGIIPTTSSNGYRHVDAVTSATAFTLSTSASSTTSGGTLYAMNCIGFLSGASTTSGSNIITVSDTTPLYVGMRVSIVSAANTWSTTAGSTSVTVANTIPTTVNGVCAIGEGVSSDLIATMSATAGTTTVTLSAQAVATVANKPFYYTCPTNALILPVQDGASKSLMSYAKIVSIDSATQITIDVNALATVSNQTLAYAFTGGAGGNGGAAAVEVVTYF